MKNSWLLAVVVTFGLGGCAGLRQFPEVSPNPEQALHELDAAYEQALVQMRASRKAMAAQIFQRWTLDMEHYPPP